MAARIATDPYTRVVPDFASGAYAPHRQVLAGQDDAQAAQLLASIWTADNVRDRQLWDEQVAADAAAEAAAELVRAQQRALDLAAAEEASKEADKKRVKLPKINHDLNPSIALRTPISPYASTLLRGMKKVELWYFTRAGLESASAVFTASSADSFTVVQTAGVLTLAPANAHKASPLCVADRSLSWDDFTAAHAVLIDEMGAHGWDPEIVQMFQSFFFQLVFHPTWRTEEFGTEATLVYQDEARSHWHRYVDTTGSAYNITKLNDAVFEKIYTKIKRTHETRIVEAAAALALASIMPPPAPTRTPYAGRSRRGVLPLPSPAGPPPPPRYSAALRERSASPVRGGARSFPEGQPLINSACAICLGRHPHNLSRCTVTTLWSGKPAFSKRNAVGHIATRDGRELCLEFQRPGGCKSSNPQKHLHQCSGCGQSSHGAFSCPLSQKA